MIHIKTNRKYSIENTSYPAIHQLYTRSFCLADINGGLLQVGRGKETSYNSLWLLNTALTYERVVSKQFTSEDDSYNRWSW